MFQYEPFNLKDKNHLKLIKEILLEKDPDHTWKDTFYYFQMPYKKYLHEKQETSHEWLIKDGDEFIGWMRKYYSDMETERVLDLDYIIAPSKRGRGYGTRLIEEQEKLFFQDLHNEEINLIVGKKNLPNRALLEKLGYQSHTNKADFPCIRYWKRNPNIEKEKGK